MFLGLGIGGIGGIGKVFSSVSGIAKQATGSVSGIRKVLDLNPQISPFKFPPQVDMGIQLLNQFGIKIPTPDDLMGLATGQIDTILKGVSRPVLDLLTKAQGDLMSKFKNAEGLLQSIEWLL